MNTSFDFTLYGSFSSSKTSLNLSSTLNLKLNLLFVFLKKFYRIIFWFYFITVFPQIMNVENSLRYLVVSGPFSSSSASLKKLSISSLIFYSLMVALIASGLSLRIPTRHS